MLIFLSRVAKASTIHGSGSGFDPGTRNDRASSDKPPTRLTSDSWISGGGDVSGLGTAKTSWTVTRIAKRKWFRACMADFVGH